MKHIKQGTNECFPTVLAMLTDQDVNKILAEAQAISPITHSWGDFAATGNPEEITLTYRALCRKYAIWLIDYCEPVSAFKTARDNKYLSYEVYMDKTARGRGVVLLCSRFMSRPGAHICAFEEGVIYCSGMDGPISAHDYYVKCAMHSILCPYAVVVEY